MHHPAWTLVVIGLVVAAIGAVWLLAPYIPWLGKLPGDIRIEGGKTTIYIPVTTCVLLSLLLTALMWAVLSRRNLPCDDHRFIPLARSSRTSAGKIPKNWPTTPLRPSRHLCGGGNGRSWSGVSSGAPVSKTNSMSYESGCWHGKHTSTRVRSSSSRMALEYFSRSSSRASIRIAASG